MSEAAKAEGPPAVAKKPPVAVKKVPPAAPQKKPVPPPVQKKRPSVSALESGAAGSTEPNPLPSSASQKPPAVPGKPKVAPPPPVKAVKLVTGSGTEGAGTDNGPTPPTKAAKPTVTGISSGDTTDSCAADPGVEHSSEVTSPVDSASATPNVAPKKPAVTPKKPAAPVPAKPSMLPKKPTVASTKPNIVPDKPAIAPKKRPTAPPLPEEDGIEDDTSKADSTENDGGEKNIVGVIAIELPESVYETNETSPPTTKAAPAATVAPPPRPALATPADGAVDRADVGGDSDPTISDTPAEGVQDYDSGSDVGVVPIVMGDAVYETMDAGASKPQRPPPRAPPPVPPAEDEVEIKSYKDRAGNAEIGVVAAVDAEGVYGTTSAPVVASYEVVAPPRPAPPSESNADVGVVVPVDAQGLYETHDTADAAFDGHASKDGNSDVGVVCVVDGEGLYETGNPDLPSRPPKPAAAVPTPDNDGDDAGAASVASKSGNSDVGVVVLEDADGLYETLDSEVGTGDHLFASSPSPEVPGSDAEESDSHDPTAEEDQEEDLPAPPRTEHPSVSGGPPPVVVPFAESGVVTADGTDEAAPDATADDGTGADGLDDDDKKDGAKKKRWGAKLKGFGKKIQMRMGKKAAPDAAKAKPADAAGPPGEKSAIDDLSNEERLEILMQVSGQLSGGTMSVDEAIAAVAEKEKAKRAARAAGAPSEDSAIEEYTAEEEARERLASRAAAKKAATAHDADAFALTDEERLAILLKAKAGISQEEIYGEVREKEREKARLRAADRTTAAPDAAPPPTQTPSTADSTEAAAAAPAELAKDDLAVFDAVSQQGTSALTHLTARRAKPPTKRPPTRAVLRGKRSTDHELVRKAPASKMFATNASLGGESSSDTPVPQPRARPTPTVRRRPDSAPGAVAVSTVTSWLRGIGLEDKYAQRFREGGYSDVECLRGGGLSDAELDKLDITDTADRRALLTSLAMPAPKPRPTQRVRPKVVATPTAAAVVEEPSAPSPLPPRSAKPAAAPKPVPTAKPATGSKPSTTATPDAPEFIPETPAAEDPDSGGDYERFMDDPKRAPPVPADTDDTNATVGVLVCPTGTGVYDTCSEPARGARDKGEADADAGQYEVPEETSGLDSGGGLPEPPEAPSTAPARPPKKTAPADAPPPARPPKAAAPVLPAKQAGGSSEKEDPAAAELRRAVRKHIRDARVELWNPPYTDATGNGHIPKSLADSIAPKVEASPVEVFTALEKLRVSARKKLGMVVVEGGSTYAAAEP
eukprot:m.1558972 g.1558972  ORF g.1558972 m.1558972 type:complete len:1270 (+) comp25274_c1_seq19:384-4193(+)